MDVSASAQIELEGVRVHNLKGISVRIRRNALTVICGVSGSGKSSLAFDTLFAEGQRRYIETFSPSARQFLDRIERPAADRIDGIPPAIAIRQNQRVQGNRSTVGTRTEILDYLRLLFVRAGSLFCPECGSEVVSFTAESAAAWLQEKRRGSRAMIAFRTPAESVGTPQESFSSLLQSLQQRGFSRVLCFGRVQKIESLAAELLTGSEHSIPSELTVILDRLQINEEQSERLTESLETALINGDSECIVFLPSGRSASNAGAAEANAIVAETDNPVSSTDPAAVSESHRNAGPPFRVTEIDGNVWTEFRFSGHSKCGTCGKTVPEAVPEMLNFNSVIGACPNCRGTGLVSETTADDKASSAPRTRAGARKTRVEKRSVVCPVCHGIRLNRDADAIQLSGRRFTEIMCMELTDVSAWLQQTVAGFADPGGRTLRSVVAQLQDRLRFLLECGVGYVTLNRAMNTLSGGEAQRVMLTAALGSGLVSTLYVLDEPTSGLHADDTEKIIKAARRLKNSGNTLVVVEHDPQFILAADEVLEIGPGAGVAGGQVVFQGTPTELLDRGDSATGQKLKQYLEQQLHAARDSAGSASSAAGTAQRSVLKPAWTLQTREILQPSSEEMHWIEVEGACCHNIVNLDVRFPLGLVIGVSGVSGSGKSSLIVDTLYPACCRALGQECETDGDGTVQRLKGLEAIDQVMLLDQRPLQKSSRSIPATWIGVFDDIRRLMAETHEAKKRNYTPGSFSFNSARGGRCPVCEGLGIVTIDMQFLADIETICEQCQGRRFRPDILEIRYRDRSINDILEMTADEAFTFLNGNRRIQQRLNAVRQAGLGYLRLGQPLSTMSGGEAQRLRIASLLAGTPVGEEETAAANRRGSAISRTGRTLFLLDEPSAGLHLQDIDRLIDCLQYLVRTGHTIILAEHDNYLLSRTNYLIEMGPGAGSQGGRILREGLMISGSA